MTAGDARLEDARAGVDVIASGGEAAPVNTAVGVVGRVALAVIVAVPVALWVGLRVAWDSFVEVYREMTR